MTSFADPPQGGGDATRTATVNLQANVSGYSQQMAQASAQTSGAARAVDELQSRLHGLNKWAGRKLFQFSAADFTALAAGTADAAVFQKQLSTLSATAAVTGTSMRSLKGGVEDAFTSFGVSRGQVIALVESITNLGVTAPSQIASLTQTFIKLGAATGEPMTQLAGGLVQLSRLMGSTDSTQIGNFANSLLTVSKNAGVSASGVLDFAQNIAPMARQAGIGEASVIGISTAFNKAGADGFVAANAFNTIMSDITTSTATGSPELKKYSNLLGVTESQFAKMDKTTAFVDIFKELTKLGPQAVNILNSIGLTGIRSQAAIAAVTQGGDLEGTIAAAQAAQGNQGNLNKGAHAATNNLADSMARVRNQFTQFGTEIGTTFLAPMTKVADVTAKVGHHLNDLIRPLAPLIAGLGAIAGGAGVLGGTAVNLAGAIGAYALVSRLRTSVTAAAFKAGGAAGRDVAGGVMPEDRYTRRFGAGEMGRMERLGYLAGFGGGGMAGPRSPLGPEGPGPLRQWSTWRNLGISAPFRVAAWASRQTEQFMRDARTSADERLDRVKEERQSTAGGFGRWVRESQGRSVSDTLRDEGVRTARQYGSTIGAETNVGAQMAGTFAQRAWQVVGPRSVLGLLGGLLTGVPMGSGRAMGGLRNVGAGVNAGEAGDELRRSAGRFSAAIGAMAREPRAGFSALRAAALDAARSLGALTRAGIGAGATRLGEAGAGLLGLGVRGVAGTAKLGWSLGAGALRAAFSPLGIGAAIGGSMLWSHYRGEQKSRDLDQFLNPIQKYNDLLGTTTTNLANFNSALGMGQRITSQAVETMSAAMRVGSDVVAGAPNKPVVGAWKGIGKSDTDAQLAMLGSMPISDPKQLRAAQGDMIAAGISQSQVQKVMDRYAAAGGPDAMSGLLKNNDYGAMARAVIATEGHGTNLSTSSFLRDAGGFNGTTANQSKSGAAIIGAGLSGIESQRLSDTQNVNAAYGAQRGLQSATQLFGPMLGVGAHGNTFKDAATREALARGLSKLTGGGYGKYNSMIKDHGGALLKENATPEEQQRAIIEILAMSKQGQKYLSRVSDSGGTLDPAKFKSQMMNLQNTSDGSDFNSLLRLQGGDLGRFAARDKTVQSALGVGSGNFVTSMRATELLRDKAVTSTGSDSAGMAQLMNLMVNVDPNSPAYKDLSNARKLIQEKQQYAAPYQSRAQQSGVIAQNYQQAQRGYDNATAQGTATTEQYADVQDKKQQYEASKVAARDYFQQMYHISTEYGVQRERADHDEGVAEQHAQEDFGRQQVYNEQDFAKQKLRANEDFNISRLRGQQDFDRQLANQAKSAAQTIYDPYLIVQAKYTADAATVLQNLEDQNKYIDRQNSQLDKARKMGLSAQAIQTLDLANPNNAQQLNSLIEDLMNDPGLIAKINAEAKKRNKGTATLVKSPYNLQFEQQKAAFEIALKRANEDFDKTMRRNDADFATSQSRAATAQGIALDRMRVAYALTTKRAGEDLKRSVQELNMGFGSSMASAFAAVTNSVAKYSPAAAAVMRAQLTALAKEFPGLSLTMPPAPPAVTAGKGGHGASGSYAAAAGGIVTATSGGRHVLTAEAGSSEAIIPLNERGQNFMAGLIARSLAQGVTMAYPGERMSSSSSTTIDQSTNYDGAQFTVQASDPDEMARKLKAKEKLRRLSSPVRH